MFKIELSETLGLKQVRKVVGLTETIDTTNCRSWEGFLTNEQDAALLCQGGGGNNYYFNSWLNIMKGSIPTSFDEIGTSFTATHTNGTLRLEDVLVSISNSPNNPLGFNKTTSNIDVNPCILNTFFKPAIKSGVATWFSIITYGGSSNLGMTDNNITDFGPSDIYDHWSRIYSCHMCYGTIGLTGSGADLEISDVNVVKDLPYSVSKLRLKIPTSWEY